MIGPYFFENDNGTTVTVNSELYGHMITDFFLSSIEEYDLENMRLQQDGTTYRTTRAKMALLQETFPGRAISRRGDINWSPISCDFLWGYVIDRVYADKLSTPEHMCQKVVEN